MDKHELLYLSVVNNDIHRLQSFIKNGADIQERDESQQTLLHFASSYSHPRIVRELIAHGGDVHAVNEDNLTPLHYASACYNYGKTPIYSNESPYVQREVVSALIAHGANVNAVDDLKKTPLHYASEYGRLDAVRELIANGANLNAKDNQGKTPLHHASEYGQLNVGKELIAVEVVNELIRNGADMLAKDSQQKTAMDYASSRGRNEVKEFIQSKMDAGNPNRDNQIQAVFLDMHLKGENPQLAVLNRLSNAELETRMRTIEQQKQESMRNKKRNGQER